VEAARHAIDFFRYLRHSKGEWAGAVIELEPWQMFRIGSVFGWMRENPDTGEVVRRFRIAYNEVARKNGKSTESAGIGLYMLDADGEPGAEVYSAAPLALDTPILTTRGWTTMGELQVGD